MSSKKDKRKSRRAKIDVLEKETEGLDMNKEKVTEKEPKRDTNLKEEVVSRKEETPKKNKSKRDTVKVKFDVGGIAFVKREKFVRPKDVSVPLTENQKVVFKWNYKTWEGSCLESWAPPTPIKVRE